MRILIVAAAMLVLGACEAVPSTPQEKAVAKFNECIDNSKKVHEALTDMVVGDCLHSTWDLPSEETPQPADENVTDENDEEL